MKRFRDGDKKISIKVNVDDLEKNPQCPHGPTLLFIRGNSKFFACSAYRNRKDCKFYLTHEDWVRKRKMTTVTKKQYVRDDIADRYNEIKQADSKDTSYCHTCSLLFITSKEENVHAKHDVTNSLTDDLFLHPSKLIKPLIDNKKEAQYFFAEESITALQNMLEKNAMRYILCLGAPRVHEYIKKNCDKTKMTSLFLDIDDRYSGFNEPGEFCQYNLFNNHFFKQDDVIVYEKFLKKSFKKGGKICIIMDPPFGGRLEPIARTFQQITNKYKAINNTSMDEPLMATFLVMPYFMEPLITNLIPSLKMVDYQVTYENHSTFQNLKKNKNGSPVRIFTNIPLKNIILPEGNYKHCEDCDRWVGKWNNHCFKCNGCTSKNGTTYMHCDTCERCVKSTWVHCFQCNRCCLDGHQCTEFKFSEACYNCNKVGHRKSVCPEMNKIKLEEEIKSGDKSKKFKKIKR